MAKISVQPILNIPNTNLIEWSFVGDQHINKKFTAYNISDGYTAEPINCVGYDLLIVKYDYSVTITRVGANSETGIKPDYGVSPKLGLNEGNISQEVSAVTDGYAVNHTVFFASQTNGTSFLGYHTRTSEEGISILGVSISVYHLDLDFIFNGQVWGGKIKFT